MKLQNTMREYPIRQRLLTWFVLQMAVVLLLSGFLIHRSVVDSLAIIQLNSENIVNETGRDMADAIDAMESVTMFPITRTITGPPFMYRYLSFPNYYTGFYNQNLYYKDIEDRSNQIFRLYPNVRSTGVVDMQNGLVYMTPSLMSSIKDTLPDAAWMEALSTLRGQAMLIPPESFAQLDYVARPNVAWLGRAIISAEGLEKLGYVFCATDMTGSLAYFERSRLFDSQEFALLDDDGALLLGELPGGVPQPLWEAISAAAPGTGTSSVRVGGMLYEFRRFAKGYTCLVKTPFSGIIALAARQNAALAALLLLLVLATVVVTRSVLASITRPIKQLAAACEKITEGDFAVVAEQSGNDELTAFTGSFNTMLAEINRLIEEVYKKDALRDSIEIQMLRSQINPHFFYNTLETIRAQAEQNDEPEIAEMALLMAKTLRYGISSPGELVPLWQELHYLQLYTQLQKLRFKDDLQFVVAVDAAMHQKRVIKMLLQPMIENSIYHGFQSRSGRGTITLMGYTDGGRLVFQVIDDGVGMDEETVRRLNGYVNDENELFKSLGLRNINRRIKLVYGAEYGLHIESRPQRGTMITVSIPDRGNAEQEAPDEMFSFGG